MTQQDSESQELLTFKLGNQEYALDIMSVREIRGWTNTTPMPHAPIFMRGVINLRGTVLPVMDLAARLGLPPIETTERNVIIVVKCNDVMTGLLVDAVSDIIALTKEDTQPPPDSGSETGASTIKALSLINERMIRILELDNVVSKPENVAA